eukprot:2279657-Alexandrium_andersonii.AAC.1
MAETRSLLLRLRCPETPKQARARISAQGFALVTTAYRGGRAARTGQSVTRERMRCQGGAEP